MNRLLAVAVALAGSWAVHAGAQSDPAPAPPAEPPAELDPPTETETPTTVEAAAAPEPTPEPSGTFVLLVDEGARVTADDDLTDHVLTLEFWRQEGLLATQLRGLEIAGLNSFTIVPGKRSGQRLDLRLDPDVLSANIVRRGRTRLEITLSSSRFDGAAVRVKAARAAAPRVLEGEDEPLSSILAEPLVAPPRWVLLEPFYFPLGADSPLREPVHRELRPREWGFVPPVIRDAWRSNETVREAVSMAEQGDPRAAAGTLHALETPDDATRVLLALARGWIWGRSLEGGGTANDAVAAEAYQLAAALAPDAPWEPWARGRAAYHYERSRQWDEALIHYQYAIEGGPEHRERPYWELGVGVTQLGRGRFAEGLAAIERAAGQIPVEDEDNRFEARLAVLFALHANGDYARAGRVLDLLFEEHPVEANDPRWTVPWALVLLDAGRAAQAVPWLERVEVTAQRRVRREHARWWSHEAALAMGDLKEARLALRRILEQTPGSALVPLAKLRLRVLDLLAQEPDKRETGWPAFGITLRELAQEWPFTALEDEALSMAAQIFFTSGLLGDGLSLYAWIEARTDTVGGATAYEEVVCRYAPVWFQELRASGEYVAALGVWSQFLEGPEMQSCVDPRARAEAAATALTAGLPDLALRWLGQAVAEGRGGANDTSNLITMSRVYLEEGRADAARRTLEFIENSDLPTDEGELAAAWGELLLADGEPADAVKRFDRAIRAAGTSVRGRGAIPSLRYWRGLARHAAELEGAEADLVYGLENGGTEDIVGGWLRVAGIRQELAIEASDTRWAPRTDAGRALWESVLAVAELAEEAGAADELARAVRWHRASALVALGKTDDGLALLDELGQTEDAWGLLARQRRGSLDLERSIDEGTSGPP